MLQPQPTVRKMQPVPWILTEAAHPVASRYDHLVQGMDGNPSGVSLLRIADCTEQVLRYACVIQLAHRFAVLGENAAWERQILESPHPPDGPDRWLTLLEDLTDKAHHSGWEETRPIHEWLAGQDDGRPARDLLRTFCLDQARLLPAGGQSPEELRLSDREMAAALGDQFSLLNRLLRRASFLKSWPLLQRFQGTTKAWMGREPPRDSQIRTPRRLEGHFVLYWGNRRFLSLSPYISLLARPLPAERWTGRGPPEGLLRFQAWALDSGRRALRWIDKTLPPRSGVRTRARHWTEDTVRVLESTAPLRRLLGSRDPVTAPELADSLDTLLRALKAHRLTPAVSELADFLRAKNVLPNERSTEHLIGFLVEQARKRSPVPIPEFLVSQFWTFFSELERDPQNRGLMEINYDILRSLLQISEPLILAGINLWKQTRQIHEEKIAAFGELLGRVSKDAQIFRRQVLALRHIKAFLEADPADFALQARIVARMVSAFGPFFIKFAQVAATHSDFLPREIAAELEQFQEEVPPMPADQVLRALEASFGQPPSERYVGLQPDRPLQSGSIASVYLARKIVVDRGREILVPVILKVAREDLEREFLVGEKVLELALLSTHYWAPHSKLSPFLEAWTDQLRQWSRGFRKELDFRSEAEIQESFRRLGDGSRIWSAPQIFAATDRVLEMEYVSDAESMKTFLRSLGGASSPDRDRNRVARNLLFTVLLQAVRHRKMHGDLHPGNILVDRDGRLHLIDWGNVVDLREKILPLLHYAQGVLLADRDRIAEALVAISSDPEAHRAKIEEIRETLGNSLRKKGVRPLRSGPLWTWLRDPRGEVQRRLEAIPHLLSNTQSLGIAVDSDYLQMSRSLSALLGTYLSLFPPGEKMEGLFVLVRSLASFPLVLAGERLSSGRRALRRLAPGQESTALFR